MKILWVCNVIPPVIAKQLNIDTTVKEGWIDASLRRMLSDKDRDISMSICVPAGNIDSPYNSQKVSVLGREVAVYRFLEQTETPWVYDQTLDIVFSKIIKEYKPDVIHIFGTEYPHTLACIKACEDPAKVLIGIQGVMSACAKYYCGGLPDNVINATTFRDWLKKDNIAAQQHKFELRADFERESLKRAIHVTGRTQFDKEETLRINPQLSYHAMNETLRAEFYEGEWKEESLNRHRIFVSQADYPLKGFHVLLEAMKYVLEKAQDTHICVAGNSITGYSTIKEKIKIGTYGKYLLDMMKSYGLYDKVTVLGKLNAAQMREYYENSSIYVCTSYIENSPNSLGEAMLVGTPSIVTKTGGIPSMASEREVLFYNPGDSKKLADNIIEIFEDKEEAKLLSQNSRSRARLTHDPDTNFKKLLEIYDKICQK